MRTARLATAPAAAPSACDIQLGGIAARVSAAATTVKFSLVLLQQTQAPRAKL